MKTNENLKKILINFPYLSSIIHIDIFIRNPKKMFLFLEFMMKETILIVTKLKSFLE